MVIGRAGSNIKRAGAMEHVFGYTVINDVTARDIQNGWGGQWFKGKSLDGSCPMGPWVITADEVPDVQALQLQLRVNGVVKQDANTRDMIYPVDAIIEWLSVGMTLLPGMVIASGTPEGVGFARTPPEFLHAGDVMESEVRGGGAAAQHHRRASLLARWWRTRRCARAPGVVARLAAVGVTTVHEAQGRRGLLDPSVRPIQEGTRLAGTAVTVLCQPGDNLMIHLAVERCREGDVLVVAMAEPSNAGVLGELLATSLRAHGVVAAIVDAGVRDVAELRAMGFPVWSRWISAQGTTKVGAGTVNETVVCGGQAVSAGDVIVADDDGVVCVAAAAAAAVADAAEERALHEGELRGRLAAGELTLDLLDLRSHSS